MNTATYPLGHTPNELDRLDTQAMLLREPFLEALASKANSCLEIGCGNGSNLAFLYEANPNIKYTGIDTASPAIAAAKSRYAKNSQAEFLVMDGSSIDLESAQFDLIFTKLVLWSVGPAWSNVLQEAYRLLAPGGTFYALEPCNHLIEIYPEKPAAKAWMNAWDEAAIKSGLDPYIGTKVADELQNVGFTNVDSKFYPIIAPGSEEERYKSIVQNLKGFYMGPAADTLGLSLNNKSEAAAELDAILPDSLVMDALFVAWGTKPMS
jgi:SAM-dependent methyltransferase